MDELGGSVEKPSKEEEYKKTGLTREERLRLKTLEEKRKAGQLEAEVDPETGKDINPHIPQYISQAPWYLDIHHPTLKHQYNIRKGQDEAMGLAKGSWYERGAKAGPAATKYRAGACENCGAMTHQTKMCLERPRAKGAKWTGRQIQPDEVVQNVNLGWDGKRDRWNGYEADEQLDRIKEWELIEKKRAEKRDHDVKERILKGEIVKDDSDDEKYADSAEAVGQEVDTKTRITVRNLRIREDTAKYLKNLDVNSAYYDPKTRSMRENPFPEKDLKDITYAGDNFWRYSGDVQKVGDMQLFAWEASRRGKDVHMEGNPTQMAQLYKQFEAKKNSSITTEKASILEKYGGEEHLNAPPKELLLAQTEAYVEYSQTGRIIKGMEKATVRSKYVEDVYLLNHTCVWGSWWKDGKWGYKCCHATIKQAYCTGQTGIEAAKASSELVSLSSSAPPKSEVSVECSVVSTEDQEAAEGSKAKASTKLLSAINEKMSSGSSASNALSNGIGQKRMLGEGRVELDPKALAAALEEERGSGNKRSRVNAIPPSGIHGSNAKYHQTSHAPSENVTMTEERLEAYRMSRMRTDDPMAAFLGGIEEEDLSSSRAQPTNKTNSKR